MIVEARHRYDKDGIDYVALHDRFPESEDGCVATEFQIERVSEEIEGRVVLMRLIIRNENDEALKTAER